MKCYLAAVMLFLSVHAQADVGADVKATVEQNLVACADEDLAGMLATLHSRSPSYLSTQQAMDQVFAAYDLDYTLIGFSLVGADDEYAYARVKQRTEKVSGPAFRDNDIDMLQIFKREDGAWKLWTQANLAITYL